MNTVIRTAVIVSLIYGLAACSEDTPPLPPVIPAADLDVVNIDDETTDLSRMLQEDRQYLAPDTWYRKITTFIKLASPRARYDLTEKAEAGDADAQFELVFLGGSREEYDASGDDNAPNTIDPCSANYWLNEAARQKHAPALVWMTMVFQTGGEMGQPNRRLASFYFWTWSQLRGFGLKNFTSKFFPPLTTEEFTNWSEEFKTWEIANAVSLEPKSCPACTENCVTLIEN